MKGKRKKLAACSSCHVKSSENRVASEQVKATDEKGFSMKKCKWCNTSTISFADWKSFQECAAERFRAIPNEPGVYCFRLVEKVEVADLDKIKSAFLESSLFKALAKMQEASEAASNASNQLFNNCGLGNEWRLNYPNFKEAYGCDVERINDLAENKGCPILYIGASDNLNGRYKNVMKYEHNLSVSVWAFLLSGLTVQVAYRSTQTPGK